MKTRCYIIAIITMAFLVSTPSFAAEVPSNLAANDIEEFGSESDDSEESDDNLADLNEPVSESDIGNAIDVSNLTPDVVDEPIDFDDSFDFDDNEAPLLATPIPAAIWLFTTGLLGISRLVKHNKKLNNKNKVNVA